MYLFIRSRPDTLLVLAHAQLAHSCLLPDLARGLLQAVVALLVGPAGAETCANDGWPRPPLEQQH